MTPWLSRDGFGEAPIIAIVFDSWRIVSGSRMASGYARHMGLRAVVFDVDFTIAQPGPDLGPEGYQRLGRQHGLELDPGRYDEARRAAFATLERHPELEHDEEIWILFTQRIIEGMGGVGDTYACAAEMTHAWEHAHHFDLFDDVPPTLEALRARGLKIGLLSNTARDLDLFVEHHGLVGDAAMVGDTIEDDIEGARAVGMTAVLVDREGRHTDVPGRIDDLRALPVALGLD